MIHHISISARNPHHVANVLAEVLDGRVSLFPPNVNSYVVWMGDQYGTMIEVYPLGSELMPGQGQDGATFCQNAHPYAYSAVHAAISLTTSQQHIQEIADREGWRTVCCDRDGIFNVIEFWVENRLMLELLPPELTFRYLNVVQPQNLEQFLPELT